MFTSATSELPPEIYTGLGSFALILTIAVFIYEISTEDEQDNKKRKINLTDLLFLAAAPISILIACIIGGLFVEESIGVFNNAITLASVGFLFLSISLKIKQ
ncbi:hypothetical protein MUB24_07100 [Lederbergia sp. NSJ-179]|uniref:hypothetical protein n=1 Tax=Lederbergia sp. NSJ-179 TaxID=2931402 RepID=UPI001FD43B9D|nr:hypothetical protein [Lederbergia sp. NSJ-179]MCJ7840678.1 hypothetical protein [Lederbergia sp. NSJ-179]